MQLQGGGLLKSLVVIFMVVVISALVMMLVHGDFQRPGVTVAINSPEITKSTEQKNVPGTDFDDGLGTPDKLIYGTLDEFGQGIESIAEFYRDINNDKIPDKITRTHIATGNDHDYQEYKIEIDVNGVMVNVPPHGFRTTHGSECALRLIRFDFKPEMKITIISRPFQDTWDTPSQATQSTYTFNKAKIISSATKKMGVVCDVATLF